MAPGIGHSMLEVIEVVAFDKFDTLPFQTIIIAICALVAAIGIANAAIEVDRNIIQVIDGIADDRAFFYQCCFGNGGFGLYLGDGDHFGFSNKRKKDE